MNGLTHVGNFKTMLNYSEGGKRVRRLVEVELQADLPSLAAQLAWRAARSRQRPKQSTMVNRCIVATVIRETPLTT